MKNHQSKLHVFTGGLLLAALASAQIGCGAQPPQSSSTENPAASDSQSLTGEALFQGVYFGAGQVGRRLDRIWKGKTFAEHVATTDAQTLRGAANALRKVGGYEDGASKVEALAGKMSMDSGGRTAQDLAKVAASIDYDAVAAVMAKSDPSFFSRFQKEIRSGDQVRVSAIYSEGRDKLKGAFESDSSLMPKGCDMCFVDISVFAYAVVAVAAFAIAAAAVVLVAPGGESLLQEQMTVSYLNEQLAL